jgi:hypothetical protein
MDLMPVLAVNLYIMNLQELNSEELINIDGGNCPAEKDRSFFYYFGYAVGWLLD